jgi:predicted nucleic acid-binding protein
MIYFDTAYILKCYLPEDGFAPVRQLLSREQSAACCAYGRLEFTTAVRRAVRENRLPASALPTVYALLETDDENGVWTWLPLTAHLIESAARAARTVPAGVYLRAGDALHLVCAREHGFDIYTNDRHVLSAAPHFGVRAQNVIP